MIHFSDFMGDLSSFEIDNSSIIISGFSNDFADDIGDLIDLQWTEEGEKKLKDQYGIISIIYKNDDILIISFDKKIFQDMMEEYEFNRAGD